jgi:hypothetical protein
MSEFPVDARVECADDPCGKSLAEDHLWGKKEKTIPLPAVDHVAGDTVYSKLGKAAVKELPANAWKRH